MSALISPGPTLQKKNVRAGNCSALCAQEPSLGKTSGTTSDSQSSQAKVPSWWLPQACLHPPTSTHLHLATITHRETLVSPLAFNLAKQTYPTSPFGKQKCSFLYLFRIRLHGGAGQTRPGQGFPHKWVWYKQPRLRPRPGSNWIAPFWLSD